MTRSHPPAERPVCWSAPNAVMGGDEGWWWLLWVEGSRVGGQVLELPVLALQAALNKVFTRPRGAPL